MQLINLTPHAIVLHHPSFAPITIDSTGGARAREITSELDDIRWDPHGDSGMHINVSLVAKRFGDVTGLPEPKDGVLYVVSTVVQTALPSRCDLVTPHDLMRDANGKVVGCRGFAILAE